MADVDELSITQTPEGARLSVKVVPGSSRDKIVGILGVRLKIATSAPPEKGRANKAVAKLLAKTIGVDAKDVVLAAGQTNPNKEFVLAGISAADLKQKLVKAL
jgi:uncharacterized protein (TIGR00251 family)